MLTSKFPASELRRISEANLILIQRHIYASYDLSVMPQKACNSCKKVVSVIEKDGPSGGRKRPNVNYAGLRLPATTTTRQQAEGCLCSYCHIGRMNGQEYARHCADVVASVGRPPAEDVQPPVAQKICSFCKGKQTTNDFRF